MRRGEGEGDEGEGGGPLNAVQEGHTHGGRGTINE